MSGRERCKTRQLPGTLLRRLAVYLNLPGLTDGYRIYAIRVFINLSDARFLAEFPGMHPGPPSYNNSFNSAVSTVDETTSHIRGPADPAAPVVFVNESKGHPEGCYR